MQLTEGFIYAAFNGSYEGNPGFQTPVLQAMTVKKVAPTAAGPERYRIILSDGQHVMQCKKFMF